MNDPSTDEPASPLEEMLQRWVADRARGEQLSPRRYLELFSELQASVETPESPVAATPRQVGPYELIEELGRGGQGAVWRAHDKRLNRQVALKLLAPHGAALRVERFVREAEIASKLDHPGICQVYEAGEQDGFAYIAMRLVEGQPLSGRIRQAVEAGAADPSTVMGERSSSATGGSLALHWDDSSLPDEPAHMDVEQALLIIVRSARALHAAHEAGVVHRDIKPANIMVGVDDEPVLLDFGLARDDGSESPTLTQSGDLFGTPAYMSPEQVRRDRLDRRTDVWSLGATLYECLTLRRPFSASTHHLLAQAILDQEPLDPRRCHRRVTKDLKVVLATALEKDRDRRYQSAAALADDLERVRCRRPIRARPVGRYVRVLRWAQRNPVLAATSLALLTAMLVGFLTTRSALGRYQALADGGSARELLRRSESLWPVVPEQVPPMDSWLARADVVLPVLPGHEAERAALATAVASGEADPEEALRHELYTAMVGDLVALRARRADVARRRDAAASLEARSIDGHARLWAQTAAAVRAHPPYENLDLRPQLGLVPVGQDPDSRLFEFAHVLTGDAPRRVKGRLEITEASSVVLVLIPGSVHELKTVLRGRGLLRREVRLDPFFVSKYEMTQAQWQRITGHNPSTRQPGELGVSTLLHPVESVTAGEAMEQLSRWGLDLPTEAQWDRAARGGTRSRYFSGGDAVAARSLGNAADRSYKTLLGPNGDGSYDDGHPVHAPVTAFLPNPFGLFGIVGNVGEWCRDGHFEKAASTDAVDLNPGDGFDPCFDPGWNAWRGGSFGSSIINCGHAGRTLANELRVPTVGIRPARALR